jgi:hypothetical protein
VTLHITNGSHAGDKLRAFVDGPVALACDVLHEGPCPPVEGDAWHEVRAQFLAGPGRTAKEIKAGLASDDRAIADACARGDDVVLWFEHDLFDQLALVRTLDTVSHAGGGAARHPRVSLICVDRFPGIERFIGLGQLTEAQLATLDGTGVPVNGDHYAIASGAWTAFRSADPWGLLAIPDSPALPFLQAALRRFLAEYPSVDNGVSLTEELALTELAKGPSTAGALFGATQAREARPFMGDSTFFEILHRLASARVPLVTADGWDDADPRLARIAITDTGREVLARRADHVRLNGIDVWRGGVHLAGRDRSPWRWDAHRETLVS